jgi:RNase P subunit RPR2
MTTEEGKVVYENKKIRISTEWDERLCPACRLPLSVGFNDRTFCRNPWCPNSPSEEPFMKNGTRRL